MARFIVRGGEALQGSVRIAGNKNAALAMYAAALLTDQALVIENVPDIADVRAMEEILARLGVGVTRRGSTVTLKAASLKTTTIPPAGCARLRGSILMAAPLVARHGRAVLGPPGGDPIGRRRLDTHLEALHHLGVKVSVGSRIRLRAARLRGAEILLDESSVTATESVMMAAAVTPGRTVIYHAACEPHIQELGLLLNRMGAAVEGLGTNRVTVRGRRRLHGARVRVGPDYVEAASFLAASIATGGNVTVTGTRSRVPFLPVLQRGFRRFGVELVQEGDKIHCRRSGPLKVRPDLGGAIPKLEDGVWPGFPSDLLSIMLVVATAARGTILFFEKLFESRLYFVDRLIEMGARIVQCDPHRVLVSGPSRLHAAHMVSPDIRAGMALIAAALRALGTSVIENAEIIDRGYERLDERLQALGATVYREE
ncbi:MAG TPA: UDP-N-acetylglucosamine 1-carboxyvinyltransferase [Kiritimatiellae bacterium]|nr:UDP-N-acetylglucosamine 1-carboxyvinyltransferase [Kiritimatiellia bacterium]